MKKKIKTWLLKTFSPLANEFWWPLWSNIRWRKSIKDCEILTEDRVKTLSEIRSLVRKLYSRFNYTSDGVDQLGDSITPPAQNYTNYLTESVKDDCDGFHSLVYHCLRKSGIECYLMSVVSNDGGHCVLLIHINDRWFVNDYTSVYTGFSNMSNAVADYNKKYINLYCKKESEVVYNGFISFDYDTGKFRSVKHELKDLLK